jgi:4-amino-4-deoxy-L-arabinose transferase-like glycosyltransferase
MKTNQENFLDKSISFIEENYRIFLAIILAVAAFNLFYNLGVEPIRDWDEARHGVNAYEMLRNKDYIVNTFAYEADYYNLKPPLSYWMVMAGYKLAGFTPLGLRIFSAISAFSTILIVALFVKYKHGVLASIISAAVLTSTVQYIISHCARTGDADSLFVLLFTLSMLSMALMEKSRRWLYLAGFSFSLAFLAKSWHSGAIAAVGGIYILFSGYILKIKLKEWALFIASTVLPVLLWGVVRYTRDGFEFFKEMITYDLLARTATPLEGHAGSVYYYILTLRYYYFYWIIIICAGFLLYLLFCREDLKQQGWRYVLALALWIVVPLLLFTKAKTKLSWYIIPIYPAMAICIGVFCSNLLKLKGRNLVLKLIVSVALLGSFYKSERMILDKIVKVEPNGVQNTLMLLKGSREFRGANIYTVCGTYGGPKHWDQSAFLAAELYGDLKPQGGGVDNFMKDSSSSALIIMPKDVEAEDMIKKNHLKIVAESETNYILGR